MAVKAELTTIVRRDGTEEKWIVIDENHSPSEIAYAECGTEWQARRVAAALNALDALDTLARVLGLGK